MISMTISGNARPSVFIRNAFSRHVISHLQYLDVSNYNISIHALQPLLMACPNLEYLAVCSEGYGIENKAILATCCPRLRHLYYRPFHVKGSIRPFTLYHNHDHDEDRPSNTNQMSLRGLHIDDVDAIHFLDQRQIAHLHLEHNWSRMNVSALRSVYRLMDQNARTLVLLDLALSPDMLEALIPSFNSFIRLTSLRISIYLDLRFTSVVNLNQINAMAAHHPTLNYIAVSVIRNPFFNPVINIRPPFISEIASIPHLKQIEWLSLHTPAITLTQLFRTATELERVIVRIGSLTLSWEMFDALVRLPLDTLELASVEQPRLLPDALHGLRHFIDHHAGPLSSMTISGCICSDRDYDAIAYAYQKLGPRFKFHRVSH
ncbi:hypothetical protein LRAMOSA08998 [Lichtheimia ramosa]|uniref:F-box domain-containing protein n=1 Tax=Lichtheimia ramosa TaxID=688394 RepID=A0A077WGH8_9FUNG|nr:hypothetical protein LRAMOSA08998 [Lichtheimia ramosa]